MVTIAPITRHVSPVLTRFLRKEDGNPTIFSVFMMVLILMITGASVDIMNAEATRAILQSSMDRAVLAAADLDQEQAPTDVVNDYLSKAGLNDYLTNVDVDDGLNYRTVSANGSIDLTSSFLHMAGYDSLNIPAASVAEEKISNVEISMVLDVSGSMGGSRIENMRNAANEFVDTVIQPAVEGSGLTTVSVVPYNATVNLGPHISGYWNLSMQHEYSNCAIFDDSDFESAAINPSVELERLAHFDLYSSSQSSSSISSPWCPTGTTSMMIAHSSDATYLKNHINSLNAGGNTAIDLGVKWGAGLLDPAARPAVFSLSGDGLVEPEAALRPAEYSDPEAIKFIVVMTDGENTTEYDLKSHHKWGMSDVWIDDRGTSSTSDDRFSLRVYDGNSDVYFWERYEHSSWNYRYRSTPDGGNSARRMSNPELFARFGGKGIAKKLYDQPEDDDWISYSTYQDMYYAYESIVNGSQADDRLSDICDAAKAEGIVIFSIAFEAPSGGQIALQDCASSPSHYFDVEGVEITETFHAIARQINSLRLIQ